MDSLRSAVIEAASDRGLGCDAFAKIPEIVKKGVDEKISSCYIVYIERSFGSVADMDKKTAIFQATLNLIAKQGFHGTSMFEIAKKAKVAAGTIYHYFSGKEELINELHLYVLDKLDDRLLTGFDKDKRIEDNLRTLWINWINFYIANPKEFLFLEQYSSSPFVTSFYFEKKDARVVPAVEYMSKAKSEGFFKDLPMEILVGIFYGPIVAIAKDCIAGRLVLEDVLIEKAFDACLDAIKK